MHSPYCKLSRMQAAHPTATMEGSESVCFPVDSSVSMAPPEPQELREVVETIQNYRPSIHPSLTRSLGDSTPRKSGIKWKPFFIFHDLGCSFTTGEATEGRRPTIRPKIPAKNTTPSTHTHTDKTAEDTLAIRIMLFAPKNPAWQIGPERFYRFVGFALS